MTSYTKLIVCLANSRKTSGRCIAGKELVEGKLAEWVRPVSSRPTHEVSEEKARYRDGAEPKLLDIIELPLVKPAPLMYQQENHVVDDARYWIKTGRLEWGGLGDAVDSNAEVLWSNGNSTYHGINDRVPEAVANTFEHSLLLIRPFNLVMIAHTEGADFGNPRRRIRGRFSLNHLQYDLVVTDPIIERTYLQKPDGEYPIDKAYLCVSLGELHNGHAYKLIAAVITPERVAAGQ